ncbi:MAG TPA: 30S ribosomal protein S6 [Methylomirabilota bacterium]|nr:30S ribosomal protein S6 [Methylomirabilota bacterium]
MKRYEGLFILNNAIAAKEDGVKEAIDRISAEISHTGGKVETIQKMDKRPFARVANKKNSAGFYVNFIFTAEPHTIAPLRTRFSLNEDVFRVLFTTAPDTQPAAAK